MPRRSISVETRARLTAIAEELDAAPAVATRVAAAESGSDSDNDRRAYALGYLGASCTSLAARLRALLAVGVVALLLVACGDNRETAEPDAGGGIDAPTRADAAVDAGELDAAPDAEVDADLSPDAACQPDAVSELPTGEPCFLPWVACHPIPYGCNGETYTGLCVDDGDGDDTGTCQPIERT